MATGTSESTILRKSDYTHLLIDYLKRDAEVKHILPRRRLSMQVGHERFCYLVLNGRVTVHRRSDDLAMATATSPALVGIGNLQQMQMDGYIKTLVASDIAILKMATVHDIISANQLWEPLAKHMMVIAGKLFESSEQLSAPSAYDIVRAQLNELFNEDPSVRNNITVESYIREKTHLSRSGVMRILAGLKKGGYIEMQRGVLINIVKLPEKY
ncbi:MULTISPECIES: winged helix-turn-helix transcriptional regulator [Enterobacter]|jgi:CRP-like cAMP-binding protein|uniref:winged helix-turn-helix transcriptional regulator n=1 Tax=Enterobacter TaxID=547 RepID=UPI0006971E35|nr:MULTISPECIES: winged helix-turn-helix transcriptional regulator [Enterobacter]EHF4997080.1 helix-turn-helix domain-containing protein [Enterobacter hormaechei]EJK8584729.1 helix-turn-helix domain-containing protein [Enterobacter hormaechei]EJK8936052.1 helix-turn-helix domain-containing protein [Enterobacter hormaechei]EKK5495846.1 helix-turn-helix domain-containing protein [Enterobacter hormaechei]EKS6613459.1 helix-turn-helix domain-containing protein [Enterobacter hormaechei]